MALSVTNQTLTVFGDLRTVLGTVTFDSSYPTGGEAVTASMFDGMSEITAMGILSQDTGGGEQVVWDRTNSKLKVFTADGTEASNGSDQSGVSVEVVVYGK